jgi:hypothetical protein
MRRIVRKFEYSVMRSLSKQAGGFALRRQRRFTAFFCRIRRTSPRPASSPDTQSRRRQNLHRHPHSQRESRFARHLQCRQRRFCSLAMALRPTRTMKEALRPRYLLSQAPPARVASREYVTRGIVVVLPSSSLSWSSGRGAPGPVSVYFPQLTLQPAWRPTCVGHPESVLSRARRATL